MSEKGLNIMAARGSLPGLKSLDMGLCESRIFGKQKRVSFTKVSREPKAEKLELVHTNVWGPSPVPSLGAHTTMSPSLMIIAERYVFIFGKINLMFLILC